MMKEIKQCTASPAAAQNPATLAAAFWAGLTAEHAQISYCVPNNFKESTLILQQNDGLMLNSPAALTYLQEPPQHVEYQPQTGQS